MCRSRVEDAPVAAGLQGWRAALAGARGNRTIAPAGTPLPKRRQGTPGAAPGCSGPPGPTCCRAARPGLLPRCPNQLLVRVPATGRVRSRNRRPAVSRLRDSSRNTSRNSMVVSPWRPGIEICPEFRVESRSACRATTRHRDSSRRTQDAGRRTQDAGRRTQDAGRRTQDAGRRTQDAGAEPERRLAERAVPATLIRRHRAAGGPHRRKASACRSAGGRSAMRARHRGNVLRDVVVAGTAPLYVRLNFLRSDDRSSTVRVAARPLTTPSNRPPRVPAPSPRALAVASHRTTRPA
jgi:hypothetical protein